MFIEIVANATNEESPKPKNIKMVKTKLIKKNFIKKFLIKKILIKKNIIKKNLIKTKIIKKNLKKKNLIKINYICKKLDITIIKQILILMSSSYVKRLWCIWELFALVTFCNKEDAGLFASSLLLLEELAIAFLLNAENDAANVSRILVP